MGRVGFVCALLALLLAVASSQSDSNSTNSPSPSPSPRITPPFPDNEEGAPPPNEAKEELGKGRAAPDYGKKHKQHNRYDRRRNHYNAPKYHDDSNEYGYDIHPHSRVKPYFDTHYCSVHGSFRLAYTEKVENKQSEGYGSQPAYGNNQGGYGNAQGGYNSQPGYGNSPSYEDRPRYIRKITRQYCRYTAAWSDKACKFCCKVVARSAYTNPDDIIAAIFSFDPADPSSNGAGVESYGGSDNYDRSDEYDNSYGGENNYDGENQGGYGAPQDYNQYGNNQGGYGSNQGGYGSNQGYSGGSNQAGYGSSNQGGYGSSNQAGYSGGNQAGYSGGNQGSYAGGDPGYSAAQYGNGPYRHKRNTGYSQAPSYGPAPDQSYGQSPADQSEGKYSATPEAYEHKPDYGNKYENNPLAINQCVCCAPKHRYY